MARTVVALYDDFASANAAVRDLTDNGFPRNDISILAGDAAGEYGRYLGPNAPAETNAPSDAASGAGVGAGIGAVIGGLGGLLIGLGALTIPGIGPVIAAGPLAAALTGLAGAGAGAVAGGVAGGILGALADMGVPHETAQYYAEGIRRGGTLVSVRTDDNMAERARDILNRHNPVDINDRATQWRQAGWTGFDTGTPAYRGEPMQGTAAQDVNTLPTENVEQRSPSPNNPVPEPNWRQNDYQTTGSEPVTGTNPSTNVNNWPAENYQGTDTGTSQPVNTWQSENSQRMNQNTDVSNLQGENYQTANVTPQYGDFNSYDAGFRNHFTTNMAGSGYTYEQYQPAYRYGYDLATNARYRDHNWNDVEPEAQRYWNERNPGTWDQIKNAVQYAWEETKNSIS